MTCAVRIGILGYRALVDLAAVRSDAEITVGDLVLDPARRAVRLGSAPLHLTRKEYDLLAYLAARSGRLVPRRELATEIWRQPYLSAEQTLDVHLCWLRRKLGETAAAPRYLRTIRGQGVMLAPPT